MKLAFQDISIETTHAHRIVTLVVGTREGKPIIRFDLSAAEVRILSKVLEEAAREASLAPRV